MNEWTNEKEMNDRERNEWMTGSIKGNDWNKYVEGKGKEDKSELTNFVWELSEAQFNGGWCKLIMCPFFVTSRGKN